MPDLAGKSFLEIGAKEGFFCGFAHYSGASRVVGVEPNGSKFQRTHQKFQTCEFLTQPLHEVPEGTFDVILMLENLEQEKKLEKLIDKLVNQLTSDGVLILEISVIPFAQAEWKNVTINDKKMTLPTSQLLSQWLEPYAWKMIGMSQSNAQFSTYFYHLSLRKPRIYLLFY